MNMIKVTLKNDVDRISVITDKNRTVASVLEENGFVTSKSYAINAEVIRDLNLTFDDIDNTVEEYTVVAVSKMDNA